MPARDAAGLADELPHQVLNRLVNCRTLAANLRQGAVPDNDGVYPGMRWAFAGDDNHRTRFGDLGWASSRWLWVGSKSWWIGPRCKGICSSIKSYPRFSSDIHQLFNISLISMIPKKLNLVILVVGMMGRETPLMGYSDPDSQRTKKPGQI